MNIRYYFFCISTITFILLPLSCKKAFDPVTQPDKGIFIIHKSMKPFTRNVDSVDSEFRSFITKVNLESDSLKKQTLVDSFVNLNSQNGFPYIEENILAHFIYYDSSFSTATIKISGDFNKWNMNPIVFTHLANTNLYYYSRIFEPDARIEYKLKINGTWKLDPLNIKTFGFGDFSINSELSMPLYNPPAEIESYNIPHGTIETFQFLDSNYSPTSRTVSVYLPPGYDKAIKYPTIYFHDGSTTLVQGQSANILDYLIYHKKIKPIISVFVNPLARNFEYLYNDEFAVMFTSKLVPFIDRKYSTSPYPKDRAISGFSFGGLVSLFITLKHHDIFGNCAAYSPALHSGDLVDQYISHPHFNAKIYLDAGTYEDWLFEPTLRLAIDLSQKGFDGHFYAWNEYHSLASWRAHFDNALIYFFSAQ